jgi:hypothetical protein
MHGNKKYVETLLEPYKIWVQAIKFSNEVKKDGHVTYRIIYDVPRVKDDTPFHEATKEGTISNLLNKHFDNWDVEIETEKTIRSVTVSGWHRYRVEAILDFYKK